MIRFRRAPRIVAFVLAVQAGCGLPPRVSDTGYLGTWSRSHGCNVSIVAIARSGDRWRFRRTTRSFDGKLYTQTIEERLVPEVVTLRYTDVMGVTDGGRRLWSYTVERDGARYEESGRPMRSFAKVANAVVPPPSPDAE